MKADIIHTAIEELEKTLTLPLTYQDNGALDGILQIDTPWHNLCFTIECKTEIRPHQLQHIVQQNKHYNAYMIVANRIFPKAKAALRQEGIAYLEANGNVFVKTSKVHWYVDAHKAISANKTTGNRAFTKTGLKVLLHLLQNKDDINLPQRKLAQKTKVGLGSIPQVIEGLKETAYLIPRDNKTYIWDKRQDLLERWITEYDSVLKPKLKKERYHFEGDWRTIPFTPELTVWGGEAAADILTNYLRPERLIFYTQENRLNLMKNYGLQAKKNGEIEAYELFWQQDVVEATAPVILIYADLVLEGGKRNNEIAKQIYNEYIVPKL